MGARIRSNPDFIALAPESLRELEHKQAWVERKVLRHFRSVFSEALNHLPEIAHVVAIETRYVGEAAFRRDDRDGRCGPVLQHLPARRHQHPGRPGLRQHLPPVPPAGRAHVRKGRPDLVLEIGSTCAYYGQAAHGAGMGFVTKTGAHDPSRAM